MNWETLLLVAAGRLLLAGVLLLLLTRRLLRPWLPQESADGAMAALAYLSLALTLLPLTLAMAGMYEQVSLLFSLLALTLVFLVRRGITVGQVGRWALALADGWLRRLEGRPPVQHDSWEGRTTHLRLPPADGPRVGKRAASAWDQTRLPAAAPAAGALQTARAPVQEAATGRERRPRLSSFASFREWTAAGAVLLVLAVSAYLRGTDLWLHPGPPFSDSPVHIRWIQDLKMNQLYTVGAYPWGMHAVLSALHLLSGVDIPLLYRIWGPISAVLWVLTTIWVGMRLSRSRWGGILAGTVVGWVGAHLGLNLARQAGTLPQEAGFLWLLPGLWWACRYLERGKRRDLVLAAAATVLVAAGHWINLAFFGLGLAALGAAALGTAPLHRIVSLGSAAAGAALVGEAHVILGLLAGHRVGGRSEAFAADAGAMNPVPAWLWAMLAIGGMLVLLSRRVPWRRWHLRSLGFLTIMLVWFGAWQVGRTGLGTSTETGAILVGALTQRGLDYVLLPAAMLAAMAFAAVAEGLRRVARDKPWGSGVARGMGALLLAGSFAVVPPPAVDPGVRFISDDMMLAVRDLARRREPLQWVAVGNRGLYSLCLGECLQVDDFIFMAARAEALPGPAGLAATVQELQGSDQLEVLAFVRAGVAPPVGPVPEDQISREQYENQWGAWQLRRYVAALAEEGPAPAVVWQGSELTVYRIWPQETAAHPPPAPPDPQTGARPLIPRMARGEDRG